MPQQWLEGGRGVRPGGTGPVAPAKPTTPSAKPMLPGGQATRPVASAPRRGPVPDLPAGGRPSLGPGRPGGVRPGMNPGMGRPGGMGPVQRPGLGRPGMGWGRPIGGPAVRPAPWQGKPLPNIPERPLSPGLERPLRVIDDTAPQPLQPQPLPQARPLPSLPGGIDQTYGSGLPQVPAQLGPTGGWQDVMNRFNATKTQGGGGGEVGGTSGIPRGGGGGGGKRSPKQGSKG